ncbi:MAG TPA: hypothetical protein DCW68_06900 [Rhodospirillaceae bacterium]|nr:MAG: hypothetical protein A2018_01410 [Alphaproteobacteria bacterium GWF2_58_20]HAU29816.1 hypothetical protein [Rhodospirillaceae bacterium]
MKATFVNKMSKSSQQHFIGVALRAGQCRRHIANCLGTDLDGLKIIEAWKPESETETHQPATNAHQAETKTHQPAPEAAKSEPKFVKVRIPVIHSRPAAQQPSADAPEACEQAGDDMAVEIDGIDEDEDDEAPRGKKRHRGWLITESEMNEIYAPLGGAQAYKGR